MPQRHVCNKCHLVLYVVFKMDEEYFKEGLNGIKYVKGKAPVFSRPFYIIKSGKSRVKTGE